MARCAAAYARACDQDAVAINMHRLLRNADQDHEGTLRRNFRVPPIFSRFQFPRGVSGGRTLRVKGGLVHREGSGEKRSQSKKQIAKFHSCPKGTTTEAGPGVPAYKTFGRCRRSRSAFTLAT